MTAALALSSCSSHWFEQRLVSESGVPHLTRAEWKEIVPQFEAKKDFRLVEARRTALDRVEVKLAEHSDPTSGVVVIFALEQGHWIEKPDLAEDWVVVGKAHLS